MYEQPTDYPSSQNPPPAQRLLPRDTLRRLADVLDIRPAERSLVALLIVHSLFSGMAIVFSYTSSMSLFLDEFGPSQLPYIFLVAAGVMILSGLLYTRLATSITPRQIFVGILIFLLGIVIFFYLALSSSYEGRLVFALLVWHRFLFALVLLQFWGLAGYLFTLQQGKRLFGLIGVGEVLAQLGAYAAVPFLVTRLGTVNLLLLVAFSLAGALITLLIILRLSRPSPVEKTAAIALPETKLPSFMALTRHAYFRLIFLVGLFAYLLYFAIDLGFFETISDDFDSPAALASFLGIFFTIAYGIGLFFRMGITGRILNRFGLRIGLILLPVSIALLAAGVFAGGIIGLTGVVAGLMLILRQLMEVLLFTLYQPAALLLYQPLAANQRISIQTLTDTVAAPAGIGLAGVLLLLSNALPGFGVAQLAALVFALGALWALVTHRAYRGYLSTLHAAINRRRITGKELNLGDASSLQVIRAKLDSAYPEEVIHALNLLAEIEKPEVLAETAAKLSHHPDQPVRLEAMRLLALLGFRAALPTVRARLDLEDDPAVKAGVFRALCALDPTEGLETIEAYLDDPDHRLRRGALASLLRYGGISGILVAGQRFLDLIRSPDPEERTLAATVLGDVGADGFYKPLLSLLADEDVRVRHAALKAAGLLRAGQLWPDVIAALDRPADRPEALSALCRAGASALPAIASSLKDGGRDETIGLDLIRLLGRIRSPEAAGLLWGQLTTANAGQRAAISQALSRSNFQAETDVERERVDAEILIEISQAAWILAALQDLENLVEASLLHDALAQALIRRRLNLLWLLSLLYDRVTMRRIIGQIASSLPSQQAYALELLLLTVGQKHKQLILPLVEELGVSARLERLAVVAPQESLSPEGRVAAVLHRPAHELGSWPKACALYAVGLGRFTGLRSEVVVALRASSGNRLVGETAAWALEHLALDGTTFDFSLGERPMILTVEKVIILKTVDIFSQIPDEILADVAEHLVEVDLPAGDLLFAKGDTGDSMYIVVSGRVRVHDRDQTLDTLTDRDVFGEMAILDPAPRMASVTAEIDTLLLELPQHTLYELSSMYGEVTEGVIRVLTRRLRERSSEVQQLKSTLAQSGREGASA